MYYAHHSTTFRRWQEHDPTAAAVAPTTADAMGMTEQQQQEMEQLQRMQEMQQKSFESMTKSLPRMSSFMNSMMGAATKLEEMKKERSDIVHTKTAELEAKIEEVLALVDEGKKSHAKLKALLIKWTPMYGVCIWCWVDISLSLFC